MQELIANLKDATRYLLQNGQTKQGLAVQACVTMLEDGSDDESQGPHCRTCGQHVAEGDTPCSSLPESMQRRVVCTRNGGAPLQVNGKPWDCAKCGHPILADLVWGETAGAFHAECRRAPLLAHGVTPLTTFAREVAIGAYKADELPAAARLALERAHGVRTPVVTVAMVEAGAKALGGDTTNPQNVAWSMRWSRAVLEAALGVTEVPRG